LASAGMVESARNKRHDKIFMRAMSEQVSLF